MADEVLGITGVVNFDDIKTTFNDLISRLERVGARTDELSGRMTKALSDIAASADKDKAGKAMEVLRQTIAEANKELGETPLMIANASKEVENIEKAIAKLEEKQGKTVIGSKDFDSIAKQLENQKQTLQLAKEDVKDLTEAQAAAQQSVSDLLEMYGKLAGGIDGATVAKESNNAATETEKRSIKELRDEYKQYQKDIQDINTEIEKLNAERTKQQGKVTRYQAKSDTLAANGATKGGYDSQSADYRRSLEKLEKAKKKLEEIDRVQNRLNGDLEKYTNEAKEVKDAIDNYSNAAKTKTPITEYRALRNELIELKKQYSELSAEERSGSKGSALQQRIEELTKKVSTLNQEIKAVNKTLKNDSDPQGTYRGVSQGLNMLISGFATAQGAASALGLSEQDLAEVQTMLQTSLAANNFLTESSTALMKSSALMRTINTVQVWASQKAIDAETAAKGRGTIATAALTVAQKAFNLVANANPYVLLATALLTVVGAVAGLTVAYRNNKKAAEEAQKAADERKAKLEAEKAAQEQFASTVAKNASEQIVSYQKLRREWASLGNDLNAKKKFITDNQDAFHGLGFAVNNLMDAEKLLVNNTDSVVSAIMLRAQAAAYEQRITDLTAEKIKKQEQLKNNSQRKAGDVIDPTKVKGKFREGIDYTKDQDKEAYVGTGSYGGVQTMTVKGQYRLTAHGASRINAGNAIRDNNKIEEEYKGKINSAVQGLTTIQNKLADTISATGVKPYTPPTKATTPKSAKTGTDNDGKDIIKAQEDLNDELEALRKKNEENEIANLADSRQKRLAEIEQTHKEELDAVKEQAEKIAELNKAAKTTGADKSVAIGNGVTVSGLTQEQSGEIGKSVSNADTKRDKAVEEVRKSELESMRSYLKEYGTIQQQRVALIEEWNEKIAHAQSEGERLTFVQQKDQAVKDFDNEQLKGSVDWEQLFGDVGNKSVEQLQESKGQLKGMLDNGDLSVKDYQAIAEQIDKINDALVDAQTNQSIFSGLVTEHAKERKKLEMEVAEALEQQAQAMGELNSAKAGEGLAKSSLNEKLEQYGMGEYAKKDISAADSQTIISAATQKYGAGSIQTQTLQAALNKLATSTTGVTNAQQKLATATKKSTAAQESLSKAKSLKELFADFSTSLDTINANIADLPGLTASLGVDPESKAGQKVQNVADGVNSGVNAVKDYMSGNYVGAAMNALNAVGSFGEALGIGGSSDKTLEEDTERLTAQNEELTRAIENLTDSLKDSSFTEAAKIYEMQKENLDKSIENTQELMSRYGAAYDSGILGTGVGGSSSSNKKINKGMSKSDWSRISEIVGKTVDEASDFWELTSSEMKDVSTYAPEIYAKIKGLADDGYKDAAQWMDTYIEYADQIEEIETAIKEKYTNMSFDDLKSDFRSALLDMDSDASTFAENVCDYLNSAIVEAMMTDVFDEQLEKWYDDFSDAMSSGGMSNTERDKLMERYNSIVNDALEYRDQLEEMGLLQKASSSSQSSTYGTASSMTQDQANEISGRLTASNEGVYQILSLDTARNAMLVPIQADVSQVKVSAMKIEGYVSELVDMQDEGLSKLDKIVINTNPLPNMATVLEDIYKKIKNL